MASNFYREQDAPKYILGHALELGFAVAGTVAVLIMRVLYERINKRRAEELANPDSKASKMSPEEMSALGDRSPAFRYTL
jgi:hypothetical protein